MTFAWARPGPLLNAALNKCMDIRVSVTIESQGQRAVITGDMVHHPMQLAEPHWGSHPDAQPERAAETRKGFVARYGDTDVLVIGTHFAGPSAGHIKKVGDSCRLAVD